MLIGAILIVAFSFVLMAMYIGKIHHEIELEYEREILEKEIYAELYKRDDL